MSRHTYPGDPAAARRIQSDISGVTGELALSPQEVGSLHDDDSPQARARIVAWIHGEDAV